MASVVGICNRALQRLGAQRIVSLQENSKNARACNLAFEPVKRAELRAHPWSFATKRVELAADTEAPAFGRGNAFQLPADWIKLLDDYPELNFNDKDWIIEGRKILTNDSAPLQIRYTHDVTDPNLMDALFAETLAMRLAKELCEELTQSNTKKPLVDKDYKMAIREARRANAIERVAAIPPEDSWITVRRTGAQSFPFTK